MVILNELVILNEVKDREVRRTSGPELREGLLLVALALAACSGNAPSTGITVGAETQISAARADKQHVEVVADADPVHDGRLIACSMYQSRPVERVHTVAYVSTDGGKTWKDGAISPEGAWDADCHATADGKMYFIADGGQDEKASKLPQKEQSKVTYVALWQGTGETNLSGPINFAKGRAEDREWTLIDDYPNSPYHGRMYVRYVHGFGGEKGLMQGLGMQLRSELLTSKDSGKTFGKPVPFQVVANDEIPSRGVITPDGTVVLFESTVNPQKSIQGRSEMNDPDRSQRSPDGTLWAFVSHDGGATLSKAIKVAGIGAATEMNTRVIPTIAVDRSSKTFKGRIYVAWADKSSGRSVIMSSHSDNDAKTWSTPVLVDDDFWNKDNELGPDDFMATIAVNPQGVVGIMWYDRRNEPDNVSYDVRFSASRDGGETWSPSVPIPDARSAFEGTEYPDFYPMIQDGSKTGDLASINLPDGTWYIGGHTAGMGATAHGVFHPVWVDNRTRVQQLWTAPITVDGAVVKNGDPKLAGLADRTKQTHVEVQHPSYDRTTGVITVDFRVQNTSKKRLKMPLYVRLVSWNSEIGLATATNADNQQSTPGAVWSLGSTGTLAPKAYTPWRSLSFHVSDVQSLHRDHQYFRSFLNLSARILGSSS